MHRKKHRKKKKKKTKRNETKRKNATDLVEQGRHQISPVHATREAEPLPFRTSLQRWGTARQVVLRVAGVAQEDDPFCLAIVPTHLHRCNTHLCTNNMPPPRKKTTKGSKGQETHIKTKRNERNVTEQNGGGGTETDQTKRIRRKNAGKLFFFPCFRALSFVFDCCSDLSLATIHKFISTLVLACLLLYLLCLICLSCLPTCLV